MVFKIGIIFIVSLLLSLFFYFYKRKANRFTYLLFTLRFLSLFLLGLLLLNPKITKTTNSTVKPNLLVAVDNSKSIVFQKQGEKVTDFVKKLKNSKELHQKFNISFFAFGKTVYPLDTLSFTEKHTNISLPLQQFSAIYKNKNTAVLLITDGNQTQGNNVEYLSYKNPVFPFIIGDTTNVEDVYINKINANKYAYSGNRFPVEFFVNYKGNKTATVQATIRQKGKVLFRKKIAFSKEKNVENITTYLKAEGKGQQYYSVNISSIKNEENKQNNHKNFSVKIINENAKILLLTSVIHPDIGMLKRAIESGKKRKVMVQNANTNIKNLEEYKLVILYQPTVNFKKIFDEISAKNKNYFIITGTHTNWNFLNNIQPFFKKDITSSTEVYFPEINKNYTSFVTTDIDFGNFSPLQDAFGEIHFKNNYQTLLFSKIKNITLQQPLLATFENNSQKVAVLFGENSWKWRMHSFLKNQHFLEFDTFLLNLIQYTSSNKIGNQLEVSVNPLYYANEPVIFSAFYSDENFQFDDRGYISVNIFNKNGFSQTIPFALTGNSYKAVLTNIPKGTYHYKVSVKNTSIKTSGIFKILPFEMEKKFTKAHVKDLQKLAQNTQGKLFYQGEENKAIRQMIMDNHFKNTLERKTEKHPLIHWHWLLGILLLTLSVEWFVRKYFGMI